MNHHNRQIIISPMVYLIKERFNMSTNGMFIGPQPRLIAAGSILRLLPRGLHEETARGVPSLDLQKLGEGLDETVIDWITCFMKMKNRLTTAAA